MAMSNASSGSITRDGAAFDQDAFNAQQVGIRASRSVQDVANEIRGNLDSDITSVRNATDELLAKSYKAPWDTEGTVAEVILASIRDHNSTHLQELSTALSA